MNARRDPRIAYSIPRLAIFGLGDVETRGDRVLQGAKMGVFDRK